MSVPVLDTERMSMTPVALEDFDDLARLWGDATFTQHIVGRGLTREEVWLRLLRDLGHWQALGIGNWSMRLKADGRYVGSVGVLDYRREMQPAMDAPELGWGVGPGFQGKGLAREGLRAALAWTDRDLAAPRTLCMIGPDNTPSLRLAQTVGYRPFSQTSYSGNAVILFERPKGTEDGTASGVRPGPPAPTPGNRDR